MSFSVEHIVEVWNDEHGERVEVGCDRDGLDLVEIRSVNDRGEIDARLMMPKEQAILVAKAILELYENKL